MLGKTIHLNQRAECAYTNLDVLNERLEADGFVALCVFMSLGCSGFDIRFSFRLCVYGV